MLSEKSDGKMAKWLKGQKHTCVFDEYGLCFECDKPKPKEKNEEEEKEDV